VTAQGDVSISSRSTTLSQNRGKVCKEKLTHLLVDNVGTDDDIDVAVPISSQQKSC
jgi:hypothetical protein